MMAAAISGVSVATTTLPIPVSSARRSTWTIIGKPAMSNRGLPGKRVEAMRAGIRTRVRGSVMRFGPVLSREMVGMGSRSAPIYGLPEQGQTDISTWLGVQRESLIPVAHSRPPSGLQSTFKAWSLIRNGLLRTQQDSRCHSGYLPHSAGDQLHRRRAVRARDAGKAWLCDRGEGRVPWRRRKGARRSVGADREAAADRVGREGRRCRQEVRGLPYLREGWSEPRRPEPLG